MYQVNKMFLLLIMVAAIYAPNKALAQYSGDTFAEARQKGRASVVYTYVGTPGFSYVENGSLRGLCIDMMRSFERYVRKMYNIELDVAIEDKDANDFSQFIEKVKVSEGGVFGLGNITITEARKKVYNFSYPFINNVVILMSHKKVPTLRSFEDMPATFGNLTAYTVPNSTNAAFLERLRDQYYPGMRLLEIPTFQGILNKVAEDENSFASIDFTYYLEARKNDAPVKRHPIGDNASEEFGIIMPKTNDWAPILSQFIQSEYLNSKEYRQQLAEHLGLSAVKLLDSVSKNIPCQQ